MALFSRRALQRRLDEAASFLTRQQLREYVSVLNHPSGDILPREWELAVVTAFSRLGMVEHEPILGGKTLPDILFRSEGEEVPIKVEILTVSDKGARMSNPFDALTEELKRRTWKLREEGILGGFRIEVRATSPPVPWDKKPIRLKLPKSDQFRELVFNEQFSSFLGEIRKKPHTRTAYTVENEVVDLTIAYTPQQKGLSGTHPTYTVPRSKSQNPLANALRDKIRRFKQRGFAGPYGLIVCDGDCDMLSSSRYDSWFGDSYSVRDIVLDYFRQNSSLSFVLVLSIRLKSVMEFSVGPKNLEYDVRFFTNSTARCQIPGTFAALAGKLETVLPQPMRTPLNARHHLEWLRKTRRWFDGDSHEGGWQMSDRTVKISARSVMDLLAGRETQERFQHIHNFGEHNPFESMRRRGRVIKSVRVEQSNIEEDDDEWLVFEFGESDPAISPFCEPNLKPRN